MNCIQLKKNILYVIKQRNIFLFLSLALSVSLILLLTSSFLRTERLVVIPTTGPSFWIESNKVSNIYLENMGAFLSDLLLSRCPSDVSWKNKTILEHVHPAYYHEIKNHLQKEQKNILAQQEAIVFRPERSFVESSKTTFVIEGESLVLVGKSGSIPKCSYQKKKRYRLQFQCENGRLLLTSMKGETI